MANAASVSRKRKNAPDSPPPQSTPIVAGGPGAIGRSGPPAPGPQVAPPIDTSNKKSRIAPPSPGPLPSAAPLPSPAVPRLTQSWLPPIPSPSVSSSVASLHGSAAAASSLAPPVVPAHFGNLVDTDGRRVLIGKKQEVSTGSASAFGAPAAMGITPPTHREVQATGTDLGKSTLSAFMGLPLHTQQTELARVQFVATASQQMAIDAGHVSSSHAKDATAWVGAPSGEAFRDIHPRQDEATQSQTTGHYMQGMKAAYDGRSSATPQPHALAFMQQSAILLSSFRMPTEFVSAPVSVGGVVTGQRHPTRDGIPAITNGASSHAYDDRERASTWTGSSAAALPLGPASAVLAGAAAAGAYTLNHMSLPLTASNVAGNIYTPTHTQGQFASREVLKAQTRLALEAAGAPPDQRTVPTTAPAMPLDYPVSPRRGAVPSPAAPPPIQGGV